MSVVSSLIGEVEKDISVAKSVTQTISAIKPAFADVASRGEDVAARFSAVLADPVTLVTNGPIILQDLKAIVADIQALHLKL